MFAQRSKQFGLFHRINTQVGFHVQINIQHIFRIARFFANHGYYFFGNCGFVERFGGSRYRRGGGHRGHNRGFYHGSRSRYRRLHRCGNRRLGGRNRFHFIYKRLGTFHHQGRFYTVFVVVFDTKGVLYHFQDRGFLPGNFFQPSFVFGGIRNARFAFLPGFF